MSTLLSTQFVISPPFGNYLAAPNCTRILGSFTWQARPGLLGQIIRTLRPVTGGWVNQIGLRNRGIRNVHFDFNHIYSLVGLDRGDWERMLHFCPDDLRVEVNLGCPNVHEYGISATLLSAYRAKFKVIVKLPPTAGPEMIAMCIEAGVDHFHLCNTLPSARGGISGRQLQPYVVKLIREINTRYPHVHILAGGGIYSKHDVATYALAGATHFSLSTIWFTPWRVPGVLANA
jgi:dihydroorotate dehydrogenase